VDSSAAALLIAVCSVLCYLLIYKKNEGYGAAMFIVIGIASFFATDIPYAIGTVIVLIGLTSIFS
jgi:hypothetical protein